MNKTERGYKVVLPCVNEVIETRMKCNDEIVARPERALIYLRRDSITITMDEIRRAVYGSVQGKSAASFATGLVDLF